MSGIRLRLPATSANLGPGFDTLALALRIYLEIEAERASVFTIAASGRNAEICGAVQDNLLIETYRSVLAARGLAEIPLRIRMNNQIPLGMGCGSSAAVRLAAVTLASHFGDLGWDRQRILEEACRLEGHPDNAAACWLGGFVASAQLEDSVKAISIRPPAEWRAVIVIPDRPLSTAASRAVLPASYIPQDVIANLQSVALLTAAFASGRSDLLSAAMRDRLHQPWRAEVCPLLPKLLPLAGHRGISGVALSGAGPAVLLLSASAEGATQACDFLRSMVSDEGGHELVVAELEAEPALVQIPE